MHQMGYHGKCKSRAKLWIFARSRAYPMFVTPFEIQSQGADMTSCEVSSLIHDKTICLKIHGLEN